MSDARMTMSLQGVDKTAGAFRSAGGRMMSLKSLAIGLGSVLALRQVGRSLSRRITEMDELGNRASRLGMAARDIQKLDGTFAQLGIKAGTVDRLFQGMQRGLARPTAARALARIGMSLDDVRRLSPEQQFRAIGAAIAGMEDPVERSRAQVDLLGRASVEMNVLFSKGAAAFTDSLDAIGAAMPGVSDQAVEMADKVDDGMNILKRQFNATFNDALGRGIANAEKHFGRMDVAIPMMFHHVKGFVEDSVIAIENLAHNAGLIWYGISADWGKTLKWMLNGVVEFGKASANVMAESARQIWSAITTGTIDSAAMYRAVKNMEQALVPDFEALGIKLQEAIYPDRKAIAAEFRQTLTAAAEAVDLMTRAGGDGVADEIGRTARMAVDAVTRAASAVSAASYQAFTAAIRQPGGALAIAIGQRGGGATATANEPAARVQRDMQTIINELREHTRIWRGIGVTA
jgi:hypothetical protein